MASQNKTEQWIDALQTGDVKARKEAALRLGRKKTPAAVIPLLTALEDSSWKVQRNAALSLGRIGAVEAVEPLIGALANPTLSVKRAAIHALGQLRDPRAAEALVLLSGTAQFGTDALAALLSIGAPALLYCCEKLQNQSLTPDNLAQAAAQRMIRQEPDALLRETLCRAEWNGSQRWLILETVRRTQSSLPFVEIWQIPRFSRINDIPTWCERITRAPDQAEFHAGCRQVLDYIMLGRASQRDYAAEKTELLRGSGGTSTRDTGTTLLRASDISEERPIKPSLLGRLRRWLGQEG
jgi:hypothetical protein